MEDFSSLGDMLLKNYITDFIGIIIIQQKSIFCNPIPTNCRCSFCLGTGKISRFRQCNFCLGTGMHYIPLKEFE